MIFVVIRLAFWLRIHYHPWYPCIIFSTQTLSSPTWQPCKLCSIYWKQWMLILRGFYRRRFATIDGFHGQFQCHGVMLFRYTETICFCLTSSRCKRHSSSGKRDLYCPEFIPSTQSNSTLILVADRLCSFLIVCHRERMESWASIRSLMQIVPMTWLPPGSLRRSECYHISWTLTSNRYYLQHARLVFEDAYTRY